MDTQANFVDSIISIYHLQSLGPEELQLHIFWLQDISCYKEVNVSTLLPKTQKFFLFFYALMYFFLTGGGARHETAVTDQSEYGEG